jgi:hypothetical protein
MMGAEVLPVELPADLRMLRRDALERVRTPVAGHGEQFMCKIIFQTVNVNSTG